MTGIIGNAGASILRILKSMVEVSERGGVSLAVTLQDQTTDMLDLRFLQEKVTGIQLATDTVIGVRYVDLLPGHGLTNANSRGHYLEVADTNTGRFVQSEILDITGDRVTIRQPLSQVFTISNTILVTGNPNMVTDAATGVPIDGSVTPVIFSVKPLPKQSGDITRILMTSTSTNTSDFTTFGGAPALTVGLTLRKKRANGTYKNLYTYVNNRDFVLHGFDDKADTPKVTGNATYGRAARITFAGQNKHGVAERLDGSLGEELQIVISEEMINGSNGNISLLFIAEGSELQGN